MGDRRNVIVKGSPTDQGVYLYTHWRGPDLARIVRDTLRLRLRWNDPPYLARMIFSEMTRNTAFVETGFGLSTKRFGTSGDYPDIVVTCHVPGVSGRVRIGKKSWTFVEFCDQGHLEEL